MHYKEAVKIARQLEGQVSMEQMQEIRANLDERLLLASAGLKAIDLRCLATNDEEELEILDEALALATAGANEYAAALHRCTRAPRHYCVALRQCCIAQL